MPKPEPPSRVKRKVRYLKTQEGLFQPQTFLRFIHIPPFDRCWEAIGLDSLQDLVALETLIMLNPDGPPVISGTGGVRKVRFSADHWQFGKSKGARVYYLYVPSKYIVFWLFIHMRDQEDYLSAAGKAAIRKLVKEILDCLENGC